MGRQARIQKRQQHGRGNKEKMEDLAPTGSKNDRPSGSPMHKMRQERSRWITKDAPTINNAPYGRCFICGDTRHWVKRCLKRRY